MLEGHQVFALVRCLGQQERRRGKITQNWEVCRAGVYLCIGGC